MAFRFIRTGTGELSGPSLIFQVEQGFTDAENNLEVVRKVALNAEAIANKALEEANEAIDVSDNAYKTAQAAQAAAEAAQRRADDAFNAATGGGESAEAAMQRANAAYDLAESADAKADAAGVKADAATTAADAATTTANNATTTANNAATVATDALASSGKAESLATQASTDVSVLKDIVSRVENAIDEFEEDSYTKSLDSIVYELTKKYITGVITTPLPTGVTSDFWFYNWTTDTLALVYQFIQSGTTLYGRAGTPSGISAVAGADTYYLTFATPDSTGATPVEFTNTGSEITIQTAEGYQWGSTSSTSLYVTGQFIVSSTMPDGTVISIDGVEVATITNGALVISNANPIGNTVSTLSLYGGNVTPTSTILALRLTWKARTAATCSWDAWRPLIDNDGVVRTIGNQTVGGVKTFTSTPLGPEPAASASGDELVTASWVRAQAPRADAVVTLTGDQTVGGVKTFTSTPLAEPPAADAVGNEVATASWVNSKIPSSDSVVTIADAQTVTGTKTFTSNPVIKRAVMPGLYLQNTNIDMTRATSTSGSLVIYFQGKYNDEGTANPVGAITSSLSSNGSTHFYINVYASGNTSGLAQLDFAYPESGTPYITIPELDENAAGNKVTTAAWVRNYAAKDGDVVKLTGEQSIGGVKTFTNAIYAPTPQVTATGDIVVTADWTVAKFAPITHNTTHAPGGTDQLTKFGGNVVEKFQTLSGSGTQTIDLANGNVINLTATGNLMLMFTGVTTGYANSVFIRLVNGGNYTVTYPANTSWPDQTAPTLTANGIDLLMFITNDDGMSWDANYRLNMGVPG